VDGDISLLAIYDKIASVDTKVETLTARVDEQLSQGRQRMEDHEARIRSLERVVPDQLEDRMKAVEQRMPERLSDRLTSLETDRDKGRGSSGAIGRIVTGAIAISGGTGGGVLISWLLTRH
jgi:hypothetical protein